MPPTFILKVTFYIKLPNILYIIVKINRNIKYFFLNVNFKVNKMVPELK